MWRRISRAVVLVALGCVLGLTTSVMAQNAQTGSGTGGKKGNRADRQAQKSASPTAKAVDTSRELQAALAALRSAEQHLTRAAFPGNALNLVQAAQSELRSVLASEPAKRQRKTTEGERRAKGGGGGRGAKSLGHKL